MSDEHVVSVYHLTKSFGTGENKSVILRDINFEVNKGEFVSVMGPSGCGKSTLLYLIGGLDKPTSGTIYTCGHRLSQMDDRMQSKIRCRQIGFVFQFYNLVQNLTVEENILLPVVMAGKSIRNGEYQKRLTKMLDIMGLSTKRHSIPSKLSGGQQQRVSIARAMMSDPQLILADEPIGNLDSRSGTDVMRIFEQINREMGVSIIMVTHSEESASYGQRIIRMQDGIIISDTYLNKNTENTAETESNYETEAEYTEEEKNEPKGTFKVELNKKFIKKTDN